MTKMFIKRIAFFILSAFIVSTLTFAEETEKPAKEQETLELGTLTVTANKREEEVQKVPATISAFSEADLEDAGIQTLEDIDQVIPGLVVDESYGNTDIFYRGMSPSIFTRKNPVVIYLDGVPMDSSLPFNADFGDVERIEVLRGPQGVLYGKNSLGGIINIISRKPGNTQTGKVALEYGSFGSIGVKAAAGGPITEDKLFFGFSGSSRDSKGYITNDHPDQDYIDWKRSTAAKATLRWTPQNNMDVNLRLNVNRKRGGGGSTVSGYDAADHVYRNPDDVTELDSQNISLDIGYQAENFVFKSITTHNNTDSFTRIDYSFVNSIYSEAIMDIDSEDITQEFRFQSPDDSDSFHWLGGLFHSLEKLNYNECSAVYDYGYLMKMDYPAEITSEVNAVFGQAIFSISEDVDITAGLRYETTHKEADDRYLLTNADTGASLGSTAFSFSDDWDSLLSKATLSWAPSQDIMLFTSVADGYLAGGFNTSATAKDNAKFDEQTSKNYEIGAKTSWFGNAMLLNATLYHIDIKDMHVYSVTTSGSFIASNAGKAHSNGIEVELTAKPLTGLDLIAQYSTIDSKFDDYEDYDGKHTPNAPEYSAYMAVQYRHGSGYYARLEGQAVGKTYYDDANTVSQDPYQLINAKIGYETERWDVYLSGKNLTDEKYSIYGSSSTTIPYNTVGSPVSYALTVSARF